MANRAIELLDNLLRVFNKTGGEYLKDELYTTDTTFFTQIAYPVSKHFRVLMIADFRKAKSNNDFEAFYNYSYSSNNYLVGLSYAY